MKQSEVMILAGAALFAWYLLKMPKAGAAVGAATTRGVEDNYVDMIFNTATIGQTGFGWQYFENGTAIDPRGNYYHNGQLVWKNAA